MENTPETQTSVLEDLISLWQQRRGEGLTLTPAELCRDHPELLPEMERRVAALERMNVLAGAAHETATLDTAGSPQAPRSRSDVWPEIPGYQILGELGRGGMGVVYQARQLGLNRVVALKMILHAEHAGAEERRRFRAEGEAIARLRHPHIVQIHEVGEHNGLPYFSLEFCAGGSLADQLDGTPLLPDQAAALAEQLAHAIHAAHQAGVVHRDLKPANVLLGEDGSPRISDFGLAKKLNDDRGQTASGAVLGTPSYMAPEQALGQVRKIGPATDVYALGAILYELLTGRPPFKGATIADTIHQAASDEPVPPRRLQPGVPRDLETVCLKCLQKQAVRRYDSALSLADDLARFRAGEPIRARPVGALERLFRWARRSPRVASLSAAVFLLLMLLAAGSLLAAVRIAASRDDERRAREDAEELAEHNRQLAVNNAELALRERAAADKAEHARQKADGEAHKAKEAARVLRGLFEAADPVGINGYDFHTPRSTGERITARELLDRGAARVRQDFADQPAIRAYLLDALGNAYRSLGLYDQAGPLLRDALALRRQLGDDGLLDVAESLHNYGWWHQEKGDYETAETMYREALALRERLLKTFEHPLVAATQFNLAWLLTELGESEEAERLFRAVIAVRQRLLGAEHREVGIALFGLASFLVDRQRNAEAVPFIASAAKILLRQEGAGKLGEAVALFQAGVGSREAGLPALAEPALRRSLALTRQTFGEQHIYVALVLHELADTQEKRGDLAGAEKTYRECLEVARAQVGLTHPKSVYPVSGLARVLAARGRPKEAEQLFHELRAANEKRYGKANVRVATALTAHAAFLRDTDIRRSVQVRQEADELFRQGQSTRSRFFAMNLSNWAASCWRLGQHKQAETLAREALPLIERHSGRDSPAVADLLDTMALALIDQRRYQEAEPFCRRALEICRRHPSARQVRYSVLDTVGRLHRKRGELVLAEQSYRESLSLARTEYRDNPAELAYSLRNLADVLAERGAYSQAAPLFAEAVAALEKDKSKRERDLVNALGNLALTRLEAGDVDSYRRHCRQLLQRLGASKDVGIILCIGRTLGMRSDAVSDWPAVVALTAPLAEGSSPRSDAVLVRAVVLYRAGRFAEARTLLLTQNTKADSRETPAATILLALCEHRLDLKDGPGNSINRALAQPLSQVPLSWPEKLFVQALRKEAETLRGAEKR